ncbi:hypothetical protein AB4305_25315 [Nocardia sp. 2YAB30]|uniref:hypothetical protein n=1 Tax=unclassified Nocardia TaxID=2637762 RepID=UPI003F9C9638
MAGLGRARRSGWNRRADAESGGGDEHDEIIVGQGDGAGAAGSVGGIIGGVRVGDGSVGQITGGGARKVRTPFVSYQVSSVSTIVPSGKCRLSSRLPATHGGIGVVDFRTVTDKKTEERPQQR